MYTLGKLLDEIKEGTPKIEVGQYYEVLKSIYPKASVKNKDKNIMLEEKRVTLPLACSSKAKREFKKDKSPFYEFFKDNTRGDFLEVIKINEGKALCINRSLKEDIREEKYPESLKYITISFDDVMNGTIKRVYRGIKKYI
ncbi:MAG: hypothetical protein ACOC1O_00540 [bacterium]